MHWNLPFLGMSKAPMTWLNYLPKLWRLLCIEKLWNVEIATPIIFYSPCRTDPIIIWDIRLQGLHGGGIFTKKRMDFYLEPQLISSFLIILTLNI